jgi:hypothetical protein
MAAVPDLIAAIADQFQLSKALVTFAFPRHDATTL